MKHAEFVLVDVSNTFTKIAPASRGRIGKPTRIPTQELSARKLLEVLKDFSPSHAVAASVVPGKNSALTQVLPAPVCWVGPEIELGIGIDYPNPSSIGADRLANAVAAYELYGAPSIVVDFGTAVTFDVISSAGNYAGGVIAPGLSAMTDYLHKRTALLPKITLREPRHAIGQSTLAAMQAGAVYGYRGLIAGIVEKILEEIPSRKKTPIIATGGDARLIAGQTKLFTAVAPMLTLEGLRMIACRNFPA